MIRKIAAICLTLSLLAGCSMASLGENYDKEAKIVKNTDAYRVVNSSQSQKKMSSTATVGKMDGTRTLWSHTVKETAEYDLICTLAAYGGRSKLVMIYPDDTLTTLAEIDTAEAAGSEKYSGTVTLPEGKTRIKLVSDGGESLEVNISATEHGTK